MIRLAKLTDYGIALMSHIARSDASVLHSARDIADATQIPLPTVSKLTKVLSQAGLLQSQRGVNGGYALTKPAKTITVSEVVIALEGPVALTECGVGSCEREASCVVRAPWQRINRVVRKSLADVRLSDLVTRPIPISRRSQERIHAE